MSVSYETNRKHILSLGKIARAWGGDVVKISEDAWLEVPRKGFYEAPFTKDYVGIVWAEKKIVYVGDVAWTDISHEMGHVFATKKRPTSSDEWVFLGWEVALARAIRARRDDWLEANRDYSLPEMKEFGIRAGSDLGAFPMAKQILVLEERVREAERHGLVVAGKPQNMRA
jgi:hypothetical protein